MANGPVVDPELVARRVAAMTIARGRAREARLAAEAQLLAEVMSLDLEGLRRRASARQWLCAMGECSGATEVDLGRLLGLKGGKVSVHRIRKHPVTRRLVQLIPGAPAPARAPRRVWRPGAGESGEPGDFEPPV